jgi:FAD/FMN-containing dehydrogenase
MTPSDRNRGSTFRRGEPGYEAARRATCWNQRLADRFPDVIVQANDEAEVVTAMQRAAREGLKVGVRSGGHSWAGNHVRDGGMLLDVSRLRDVQVDARNLRATAGRAAPGTSWPRRCARTGCSSLPGTARACASAATCCRAGSAGTAASWASRA